MKNEQTILIILSPGFPENEADTSCLPSQQNLVRAINKNYPAIKIIILSFQYPFRKARYSWFGNQVIAFDGKNKGGLSRLLLWRRVWKALRQLQKENKITGLFSFWCGECAYVGNHFARKNGLKHYCWILGQDARAGNKYVRRIQPKEEELVAMSDYLQSAFYRNYYIRPKQVIPNAVDPGQFSQQPFEKDIDLLAVGSLIKLKQFEIFIETVAVLKISFPNIKARICGKGPEENRLQEWINMYGLQNNVQLMGELPYPDTLALMQRSRILLHPSSYEGFSSVCLEALGAGAQVISFCKPMNTDIEHWHIVDSKESMAAKAKQLLEGPVNNTAVFPYLIDGVAKEVMGLFV